MKKYIDCSQAQLPFLCKALGYLPTMAAQCIVCIDEEGKPLAGVIYDSYNPVSVSCHIWMDADSIPSREWYAVIFDYPFNQLGVKKLVGQVFSGNEQARKLDEHFGFVLEASVKDFSPEGDLLLYTMTREQCRILNSPKWAPVVEQVRRAA